VIKDYSDPRHKPITLKEIIAEEREEKRRRQEEAERPIREAEATILETHRKLYDLGKQAAIKGQPDAGFEIPESTKALRMTVAQAKKFVAAESKRFVEENPEYFRCDENVQTINNYLTVQGVNIPNVEAYKAAWERLRTFGLITEHPPTPEPPTPVLVEKPQQVEPAPQTEELIDGWDENGLPCKFTPRQVFLMSSEQYRAAFKLWQRKDGTDLRPQFNRSRYQ
jgi:hypothetical protein